MPEAHVNDATDAALDPLDAELRSLIAEHRLDEILAGIALRNPEITAEGISLDPHSEEPSP